MKRIFTHSAVDADGWTIRKFLSLREARHFAERNGLKVVATGEKLIVAPDNCVQVVASVDDAVDAVASFVEIV